jgi:hypothetical protein
MMSDAFCLRPLAYFRPTIFSTMNLQSILEPFVNALQWTFKNVLQPGSHYFNWMCIVFAFLAIGYWLMRQKKYNEKAAKEGGIA